MKSRRAIAGCLGAVCALAAGSAGAAQARPISSGTFAAPLGSIQWRWTLTLRRWTPTDIRIQQHLAMQASFDGHPENREQDDVVPERGGRLVFQTRKIAAPVVYQQFYPYDTQRLVAWPTHLAGIITRPNIRALKLHYVYTNTQPTTSGTTDQVIRRPVRRFTLHRTAMKFWFAGANGGAQGVVYDLQTVRGMVRICRRGNCRLYWQLIYKWPPWSKIAPLGQLTPYRR